MPDIKPINLNHSQNAIVISVPSPKLRPEEIEEHLTELEFLGKTAGIHTMNRFVQKLDHPDNRIYVGKGKLEEIKLFVFDNNINTILVDDDLSASQLRNLEKELNPKNRDSKIRIYDRSLLILDIFVMRAQTAQAKTQVELAMNQYLLPRLTRLWTHLERQRGGTGTRGGAGEMEIETDRRVIKHRISLLKEELKKIDKQRQTQRKGREQMVRVALVGYTNVGKSTIMNLFSKAGVKEENKLFATVDSTVRKVVINNIPFLLSDTVGFIRKLPHHLIESFKSTLDEVREADILVHVVDLAHPFHDNQIEVVSRTLSEIGVNGVPTILVLNKLDLVREEAAGININDRKRYYHDHGFDHVVFLSAKSKTNVDEFRMKLAELVEIRFLKIYPNYVPTAYSS